jgi:hypothetical protein
VAAVDRAYYYTADMGRRESQHELDRITRAIESGEIEAELSVDRRRAQGL